MSYSPEFGIDNANDFFKVVVLPQHNDFLKNNASRRHALLAIMVAYHMFEWVHGKKFKVDLFESKYPNDIALTKTFELARHITNGTKHYLQKTKTRTQAGFSSEFTNEFARPLVIRHPDGQEQSVDDLLQQMVDFWANNLPQTE